MAVSEERIDELLDNMINNADDDGWCHVPEGLSDEEQDELSKRLTIITMQDRIDVLLEGILKVMKHMDDIKHHIDEYETIDKLKIKGGLSTIKEDSQGLLMDLHSDDVVGDFFRVEMITGDSEEHKEEVKRVKASMEDLVHTEFKDQLGKIKKYCSAMIEISDDITERLDKE
jgi:hypothetical protein